MHILPVLKNGLWQCQVGKTTTHCTGTAITRRKERIICAVCLGQCNRNDIEVTARKLFSAKS